MAPSLGPSFFLGVPTVWIGQAIQLGGLILKVKLLVASIVMVGLASPAFAASYYVVQNSKTHKCSVSTSKPSAKSKTTVLIGDASYKTKKEATDAMTAAEACKPPA